MPEATFIFEDPAGNLFAILPDAVVREDHGIAARATEQEVEQGIETTDHIRRMADRFSCEIVVSNTPTRDIVAADPSHFAFGVVGESRPLALTSGDGPTVQRLARFNQGRAEGVELATGPVNLPDVSTFQPDVEEVTRTQDNWTILRNATELGYLCTITTNLYTYRRMVLLAGDTQITVEDGNWIRVECIFRELRQAATELVEGAEPLRPRDTAQANDGSQGTDEDDAAAEEPQLRSIATNLVAGLSG